MEKTDLKVILENSFAPAKLRSLLRTSANHDVYDMAADAIFNGDEIGDAIAGELDELSAKQRRKIKSMSLQQIRESLSPEFLEPGKMLGAVVWGLMRDDRMGVRNLAHTIVESVVQETGEWDDLDDTGLADEIDDMDISDLDSGTEDVDDVIDPEIEDEEDIDVESLLEELSRESEEESLDDVEPDLSDLDDLLEAGEDESDTLEIPSDMDMDYEQIKTDPMQSLKSIGEGQEDQPELDQEDVFGHPVSETDFQEVENVLDLHHDTSGEPYLELDENEMGTLAADDEELVSLGGVYIALSSLKRACEKVFEEPIELVTDENLTADDKIVVVGKSCGVKVLYGPHYAIHQPSAPKTDSGEPVEVSPVSMQSALSRIFDETVELIPDPSLLDYGVVPFAGKKTGIEVLQNDQIKVPMPPWVNENLAKEILAKEAPASHDMEAKVHELEERLNALEQQGTAAPLPAPEPEAEPKPIPEPLPEPEPESDGDVADESLSLDDIESEELEPIPEQMPEEEEDGPIDELILPEEDQDEDIMDLDDLDALISGEETEEETGEEAETEETDTDDLDLDDLDLDSLSGELDELGDLDLDEDSDEELNENAEIDELEDTDSDKIDIGDEIDLDDLDLDLEGIDLDEEDSFEPKEVLNGETILLLGGDDKYKDDYNRIVSELGGSGEWYGKLDDMGEDEIGEMVERADVIMTLTAEAVSDPGILQATNVAQENNKRLFNHHSATPSSVQKQLMKLVEEGKV